MTGQGPSLGNKAGVEALEEADLVITSAATLPILNTIQTPKRSARSISILRILGEDPPSILALSETRRRLWRH